MRIFFMGTPDFSVASLDALVQAGHEICGVFTQPDKPKNRGMQLTASPVKEYCLTHNIPVFQPAKLRDGTAMALIEAAAPDLIAVAAYGRMLPQDILDYPKLGCLNVHSSVLPNYRGAAPINWAILNGETETGVTIMHMAAALDAGDMILTVKTPIAPQETAPELFVRLAKLGADALVSVIAQISAGTAPRVPQDESLATLAPMLKKELSPLDWSKPALTLHNQVRGLLPWPAASAEFDGTSCKVLSTDSNCTATDLPAGAIVSAGKSGLFIACGGGTVLEILMMQPAGKNPMSAADFLRGHPLEGSTVG